MSELPADPTFKSPAQQKTRFSRGNIAAIGIVCVLMIGFCVGIWQWRPKPTPTGRPIGTTGKVQAFARAAGPAGESFTIWRDGRQVSAFALTEGLNYERIELSSDDVDIAGSSAPDLVLYAWTGGAHCCFTQILVDGHSGRILGQLELGSGDPMPFIPAKTPGLARAVAVNFDDVTASKFGAYAESPMARIVAIWDGERFALDLKRMKATRADSPPTYFVAEPDLGDAVPLGVQDVGENEVVQGPVVQSDGKGSPRGDRTLSYQAWMNGEEERMAATPLILDDVASFGPLAAFLNERIYKGQAVAGVATVMEVYASSPIQRDVTLAYYFDVIQQSRWFEDLDRLNDNQLSRLATATSAPKVLVTP